MMMQRIMLTALMAIATLLSGVPEAQAERIKDIASLAAARPNQLLGYGLVVGLQGTGDGKDISFTIQSLRETLGRLGATVDGPLSSYDTDPTAVKDFKVENVAAVMVTAELPAFAKPGQKIDVNVAAIAIVYLTGSVVGQAAPTPGGLGAVEAALAAGLTAAGLDGGLAVSAVLMFRLLTFWLPTLPGWVSHNVMQRRGLL